MLSVTGEDDLPSRATLGREVVVVTGTAGIAVQRNRAIDRLRDRSDVVVFFDDDYLPSQRALAGIERLFIQHPDVVGADGRILADGVTSGGMGYAAAVSLLEAHDAAAPEPGGRLREGTGLYGCNMAYRSAAIGACRFDEALPLSAWQEDIDFAARMRAKGRIVHSDAFAGVHRGVVSGREAGRRVGYAQIANPLYLVRKGTMTFGDAARLILRNLAANLARSWRPEPYVDRRGRALGNLLALRDVLRRRDHPRRMLEL